MKDLSSSAKLKNSVLPILTFFLHISSLNTTFNTFCQNSTELPGLNHNDLGNFCFLCVAVAFNIVTRVPLVPLHKTDI